MPQWSGVPGYYFQSFGNTAAASSDNIVIKVRYELTYGARHAKVSNRLRNRPVPSTLFTAHTQVEQKQQQQGCEQ
jgi:hypothetical protein